jgi:hypothetical protein
MEGKFSSVMNNYQSMVNRGANQEGNTFYTIPGNFQSKIAPRMFGGDYGANITYNLPSRQNLAVPNSPLDFANAASNTYPEIKENYPASCKPGGEPLSYHGGAPLMEADYANGNFKEKTDELYMGKNSLKASHAALPVGDMTTLNSIGNEDQPIVYDRYMFANLNSNLRSQGDPIRGDLPIVPNNNGWFNVSVQPNIDLQQGALNVMAGVNNETSQQLSDLIYTTSGKATTAIGGVNMQNQLSNPSLTNYQTRRMNSYKTSGSQNQLNAVQMQNQYQMNLSAGGGDINVTAFP